MSQPVKPSKDNERVVALVSVNVKGQTYIFRYTNMKEAFQVCEQLSNAIFKANEGGKPLVKSTVKMPYVNPTGVGDMEVITSTFRLDDISAVAVVCPCCGEQIFDRITHFKHASPHDRLDSDDDKDDKNEVAG